MLRRVKKYIRDKELLKEGGKVLVCVSGGADSVALLDVLLRGGYACVVAHCNFGLRGAESDRDEAFVKTLVPQLSERVYGDAQRVTMVTQTFNTRAYAEKEKKSIETAARELRYRWFQQVAVEKGCEAIAVAHHQNDQAETVIMHIKRGCGLKGLSGMYPKAVNPAADKEQAGSEIPIIRPLLCTTHDYICHYLKDIRGLEWMEDSTNSDTSYRRNAVRAELANWSKAEIVHVAEMAERIQNIRACYDLD